MVSMFFFCFFGGGLRRLVFALGTQRGGRSDGSGEGCIGGALTGESSSAAKSSRLHTTGGGTLRCMQRQTQIQKFKDKHKNKSSNTNTKKNSRPPVQW